MERTEDRDYTELYDVLKGQTALLFGDVGNAPARVLKEFREKARHADFERRVR